MIVWLASWPRSGNTLCRVLLKHYCGMDSYSFADDPIFDNGVARVVGHKLLPKSLPLLCDEHRNTKEIVFIKTHKHPSACPCVDKAIYIVRDCRDALVSLVHYQVWRHSETFEQALHDRIHLSLWAEHVYAWMTVNNVVIKYEDMVRTPRHALAMVLQEAVPELPIRTTRPPPTFESLHEMLPHFFRKGQVGSWRDVLTPEQEEIVWQHSGATLESLGYAR